MAFRYANGTFSSSFNSFSKLSFYTYGLERKLGSCVYSRDKGKKKIKICGQLANEISMPRRSGNYDPCVWDYDFLQSLHVDNDLTRYEKRIEELKEQVRRYLTGEEDNGQISVLEIIEDLERLGLSYHFEKQISSALQTLKNDNNDVDNNGGGGLYETTLRFRILRQYGHKVPQDVFNRFQNEDGKFLPCICEDIKGLLSLYEASYLSVLGEATLDEAKTFTTIHLQRIINTNPKVLNNQVLSEEIRHALELPRHWRLPRAENRWYIDHTFPHKQHDNIQLHTLLLELSKLDYNSVQVVHQKDLAHLTRWWKQLGLNDTLEFARDRLAESFLWGLMASEPELSKCRIEITKIIALLTVTDDIYDVYGTLDEVRQFTDALERWDVTAIDHLPYKIKLFFVALFNTINEIAYQALKEHGFDILPYLKESYVDVCKAYLAEAEVLHGGYTQTLEEYLKVASVSGAGCAALIPAYVSLSNKHFNKEFVDYVAKDSNLMQLSSRIIRFTDDIGTSKAETEKGDIFKSIECYMIETGASEEAAKKYIWTRIDETWKMINETCMKDSDVLPLCFIKLAVNLGRIAHLMYLYGDGHGAPDAKDKEIALSLMVDPVHMILD